MADELSTTIPTRWIGPILCSGAIDGEIHVPMATYETTLWPSTNRGAKLSRLSNGINCNINSDTMTRSVILEANNAQQAADCAEKIRNNTQLAQTATASSSRHAKFESIYVKQVGKLLFIRISINPALAAGHNMATKIADEMIKMWCQEHSNLSYVSISGNICTDKKVSAINSIQGRGKHVIAEITIPNAICTKHLRTTAQAIHQLNTKKNLIGSIVAGSTCSANAHYANALLAVFLATGQDAANIVEGSQGITYTDCSSDELYFSVTLPNIIVGSIGNGKHHSNIAKNLERMQCLATQPNSARRLAAAIAATVLCSELSLLAAQTRHGELVRSHMLYERGQKDTTK